MKNLFRQGLRDATRLLRPGGMQGVMQGAMRGAMRNAMANAATMLNEARPSPAPPQPLVEPELPSGARFLEGSFTNAAGTRPYRLYVPASYAGQPAGLIVMLHGCTQSPADFAVGTGMNAAAEVARMLVLYPGQTSAANPNKCWNWFDPADQRRDAGEPSLIAGMTREVMRDYAIDPARVFVAGLSAGAAAAVVLGAAYPELFAAVGAHSGLARGSAHDVGSAFAAMRQGRPGASAGAAVPTIVFQGDQDTTVNPVNAEAIVTQASPQSLHRRSVEGQAPSGRSFTRHVFADRTGATRVEQWSVHGLGHAWSGGNPRGSYADPNGPDATAEMLRFFQEHPLARRD